MVGHSPTNEAAVLRLASRVVSPLGKGKGVLLTRMGGTTGWSRWTNGASNSARCAPTGYGWPVRPSHWPQSAASNTRSSVPLPESAGFDPQQAAERRCIRCQAVSSFLVDRMGCLAARGVCRFALHVRGCSRCCRAPIPNDGSLTQVTTEWPLPLR